jgi:hypothetical protein
MVLGPSRGNSGVSVSVGNGFGGEWGIEVGGMPTEGSVMTMVGINVGAFGGDVSQLGGALEVMVDSMGDIGGCDDGSVNDESIGDGGGESVSSTTGKILCRHRLQVSRTTMGSSLRGLGPGRRPTWTES